MASYYNQQEHRTTNYEERRNNLWKKSCVLETIYLPHLAKMSQLMHFGIFPTRAILTWFFIIRNTWKWATLLPLESIAQKNITYLTENVIIEGMHFNMRSLETLKLFKGYEITISVLFSIECDIIYYWKLQEWISICHNNVTQTYMYSIHSYRVRRLILTNSSWANKYSISK